MKNLVDKIKKKDKVSLAKGITLIESEKKSDLKYKIELLNYLKSVNNTGWLVSAEERNIFGGLGESVARLLTSKAPFPQEFVGTNDTFGESGTPTELMNKYGLNMESIYNAVINVMKRKAK